jgi:hypothetical protein
MKKTILISLIVLLFSGLNAQQKDHTVSLNGHLQGLEMLWIPPETSRWETMTTIYNRLDFRWSWEKGLSFHAGARNLFNYGQLIQDTYPLYPEFATVDNGYVDMTWLWAKDTSYFFYSNIDRLNLKYRAGKFEATVGRQRINWGINLVWTPNDIFNSFNYFDFDYVERPGCDAVLLEYYPSYTSSLQVAFKLDNRDRVTSALMYKFNKWNYDFQFLGGVMTDDAVVGAGWAGDIKGAGFNGEISYFHDIDNFADTCGVLVGSLGANYTLRSGFFMHASYLYNSAGTTGPAGWGSPFALYLDINAKNFTLARHSIFGEVSYPITPLINANVSSIFNPNDRSGFAGPSLDISLTDNMSLFFIGQLFWGAAGTEFGDYGSLVYMRLKWSF